MISPRVNVAALGAAALLWVAQAQAASLWWSKFTVHTDSEAKCFQFAYGVAAQNGLQGIRRSNLEVAGVKAGVYVAITCIGRNSGQPAIAVVMAAGDNDQNTREIRDQIAGKLQGTVPFD